MLSNLRSSQVQILVLLTAGRNESLPSCFTHFSRLHFRFSRLICSQLLSIFISGDRKSVAVAL
uniref:Light-mediated development protein DET1 n=1 Tax=Arundo donax TaxID=35708 RepID=A0A0A9GKY7_ARUDO